MDLKRYLEKQGLIPDKRMDQHFLVNEEILHMEIELAELSEKDVVLEIGAGPGNLTTRIASQSKVIAIEKDERFIPFLKEIENAEVIHGDAVKLIHGLKFNKVVSNIPYSQSQPILIELMKKKWDIAVLIVQKEFAERMKMGKLGLIVEDCLTINIEGIVPENAFYPLAVSSSLVVIRQKKLLDEKFWDFLKKIYKRNKNVGKVVSCPENMKKKKIGQLSLAEMKELYKSHYGEPS